MKASFWGASKGAGDISVAGSEGSGLTKPKTRRLSPRRVYVALREMVRHYAVFLRGRHPRHVRFRIASIYLRGEGLEIGALHAPLHLPPGAHVRYVDHMTTDELKRAYPEMAERRLVPVSIVDDGERLVSIPDKTADFVIANHLIEHAQDPIETLKNWLRVVKPGGMVFMAVPNQAHTFDRTRPTTSLQHLILDHEQGPHVSRMAHYEEWVRHIEKVAPDRIAAVALQSMQDSRSIHFHVWDELAFLDLLSYCYRHLDLPFRLAHFSLNEYEFVIVLIKTDHQACC